MEALMKKQRNQGKGSSYGLTPPMRRMQGREAYKARAMPKLQALPLPAVMGQQGGRVSKQRRPMGLCYRCGDKYFLGHQCKRQLLLLEGER